MPGKLMVIVPDRLSDFLSKGEVVERYYNPGNLFDEVHLVMTNDDRPDPSAVKKTAGRAKLYIHNLPAGKEIFIKTLGWRPSMLHGWTAHAIELAKRIRPSMIRCHGAHLNAFAAACIKTELGIPYVVSLHINPDEDVRGRAEGWLKRLVTWAQQSIEKIGLQNADLVLPVYRPIESYLNRLGIQHYEVCYNVINPGLISEKSDYNLHDPVRVVSVGRQFREKNPENLIRAVSMLPDVHLTLVGNGEYHSYLRQLAADCNMVERVSFFQSLPNDELCRMLPEFDIFAVHTEYWEISKSVLEPLLTGVPVIINRRKGKPVPELTDEICLLVDGTIEGYRAALDRLIKDGNFRERLGRAAYDYARANWAPEKTEAKYVEIYRRVMATRNSMREA